jgi:hypothetical protein
MRHFPRVDSPTRKIWYEGRHISMALLHQDPVEVEVIGGHLVRYRLVFWLPDDPEAREVQSEIESVAAGGPVIFAVEYGIPDYN